MNKFVLILVLGILVYPALGQVRFGNIYSGDNDQIQINYTNPQQFEIKEIRIIGTEFLDENALISLSGLKVGDKIKIPGDDITNALKKLWAQGIISDVNVEAIKAGEGKVSITINLRERPRLSRINYEGVNKTHKSDLDEQIKLIRGRVLTDAIMKNTELTVLKHFREKGYLNTTIRIVQVPDTLVSNSVQLKIIVDKKNKVRINTISFEGNENIKDAKLKKKMKSTGEKPRFTIIKDLFYKSTGLVTNPQKAKSFITETEKVDKEGVNSYINEHIKLNIFKNSKFSHKGFQEDKNNLITYYNSKGYRDANIKTDTVYAFDNRSINIDVIVEEGRKYYFRDIIWTGNYVHSDEELAKILAVQKGDVYDLELINKRLNFNPVGEDISSLYMDNGYLAFSIQPVEVEIDSDSIDIEMRIREGGIYTINKVLIKGNDRTNDHVILRELKTLPGQKFSRARLIRTQRELSQLGYFDPEKMDITPYPDPSNNTVDIEYGLEERPSDQIELSGGFGGSLGFVGTLGVVFNNFSIRNIPHFENWRPLPAGDGQKLALRLQANGRRFQNYSISFSEPWLGGRKPNSLSVSLSHSIQRTQTIEFDSEGNIIPLRRNDYNGSLKLTGITVGLGRRVRWPDDYFSISNSISYLVYKLDNFDNGLGFRTGTSNSLAFTTIIARNSIDNPMYPRSGSQISLSATFTPPYSLFKDVNYDELTNAEKFNLVEYHKWMFDAKYYLSLIGNLVLESRGHLGFIGAYSDRTGIGPFERFIMGGSGLSGFNSFLGTDIIALRGYDDNSLAPISGTDERHFDDNGNLVGEDKRIRGGVVFNKFVMELRYPISLNPSATIYILGFAEAGNTWNDYGAFDPGTLFKSVGIGARIFMPAFGMIGIDWGHALDTTLDGVSPAQQKFQFRIGQQIR